MTQDEKNDLLLALNMRINWIQTGNPTLSINDVQVRLKAKAEFDGEIKALSESQMEVILRMKKLERKIAQMTVK